MLTAKAMNSLGAGSEEKPYLINGANALTFGLMVVSCFFGNVIVKQIGIKWALVLGTCSLRGGVVQEQQIWNRINCPVWSCTMRHFCWCILDGGSSNCLVLSGALQPRSISWILAELQDRWAGCRRRQLHATAFVESADLLARQSILESM
jgi:hypothetical protein